MHMCHCIRVCEMEMEVIVETMMCVCVCVRAGAGTWELMILCEDLSMLAGRPKNAGLSSSGRFSMTLR